MLTVLSGQLLLFSTAELNMIGGGDSATEEVNLPHKVRHDQVNMLVGRKDADEVNI